MTQFHLRELPQRGGFSTPHVQSYHGARFCYQMLEVRTVDVYRRADDSGGSEEAMMNAAAGDALSRQALSEAVQVFCAMTVEGAINLLGVMALGSDVFYAKLERKPLLEKLEILIGLIAKERPDSFQEMAGPAKRLMTARNAFVHPKPQEDRQHIAYRAQPATLEAAQAAMNDLHEFFSLLRKCNYRYTYGFVLF